MNKLVIIVAALTVTACPGGRSATEPGPVNSTSRTGQTSQVTQTAVAKTPSAPSTIVGKCAIHTPAITKWQPNTEQLRAVLQRSEEDIRRFYEGGDVSFEQGKIVEAAEQCAKTRSATTIDMQVCATKAGASQRTCYELNIGAISWNDRNWITVYYNYGNDSMVDLYEVRAGKVQSYCAAFTPQFHKLCNDLDSGNSDTQCAKLEADWKAMPEPVRMGLCFPGQP